MQDVFELGCDIQQVEGHVEVPAPTYQVTWNDQGSRFDEVARNLAD
jgi:hypothetical protein